MKKRTNINWDNHVLTETEFPDGTIYRFKKPNTTCQSVVFINACGVLAVTGDYGNWIFCREFHPSPDGYVSDGYWLEKIRIASTQSPCDHDPDGTRKEIEEMLEDKDEELDEEEREYLESLLDHVDDGEERYLVYAHDHLPSNRDHEFVPHTKKLNEWLECIFDAFDEMCLRKKKEVEIATAPATDRAATE